LAGLLLIKSVLRRIENQFMIHNEHFVPMRGDDIQVYLKRNHRTAVHHLLRYIWASKVLSDFGEQGCVLDMASGSGYGTNLMAREHPGIQFTGVDYDPAAVKAAGRSYHLPNLQYRLGDGLRWEETLGAQKYDTVISFDTLEHVPHREILLENLVNHLPPDGRLLLSTPCGHDVNRLRPRWAGHQIEFSSGSLYDFLSRYFRTIIRPDDGELPHLEVFDLLKGSEVIYNLKMNPVMCRQPITIETPYRPSI
jgi:2-polyprenyl-3-methyl-5-hydroxy-6-metoxy-1,4-benzoquinol methylase